MNASDLFLSKMMRVFDSCICKNSDVVILIHFISLELYGNNFGVLKYDIIQYSCVVLYATFCYIQCVGIFVMMNKCADLYFTGK